MAKYIVLLLIIGVIAGLFYLLRGQGRLGKGTRSRQRRSAAALTERVAGSTHGLSQLDKLRQSGQFWGVKLTHPGCNAALEAADQEYPLKDAPTLPLKGCDATQCACIWQGLKERRHGHRRSTEERREQVRFGKITTDRRSHKDRRKGIDTWKDRE